MRKPLIHQRFKKWSSSSRWVLLVVDFLQVAYSSWPQRMCWAVWCVQFIQQSSRWPQPCSRHKENSFCHINYGTGCGLCLFLYMSSQITHQYQHKANSSTPVLFALFLSKHHAMSSYYHSQSQNLHVIALLVFIGLTVMSLAFDLLTEPLTQPLATKLLNCLIRCAFLPEDSLMKPHTWEW